MRLTRPQGAIPRTDEINRICDEIEAQSVNPPASQGLVSVSSAGGCHFALDEAYIRRIIAQELAKLNITAASATHFTARIVSSVEVQTMQYKYFFEPVHVGMYNGSLAPTFVADQYPLYLPEAGDTYPYAHNLAEIINVQNGILGNGINHEQLNLNFNTNDDGVFNEVWSLQPCPDGSIVDMIILRQPNEQGTGGKYAFVHENAIDGVCYGDA